MRPLIIGLTGGIGSGKTTVARYFSKLGVPVYIADEEAKKILFSPGAIKEINAAFGSDALTNGLPDKTKIAALVFNNREKLAELNAIIHPNVKEDFINWVSVQSNCKFVIKEAAILFESGSYKECDKIILVTAPIQVRIDRVLKRDNTTREKVLDRIKNQWDDDQKIPLSDFVISNIFPEDTNLQVSAIYTKIANS